MDVVGECLGLIGQEGVEGDRAHWRPGPGQENGPFLGLADVERAGVELLEAGPVPDRQHARPLQLALEPGHTMTRKTHWTDEWERRQNYYVSAVATEKRVYAVFSTSDLWGVDKFHGGQAPPERSAAPRLGKLCPCGFAGTATGWPCDKCSHQFCPRCGDCDCQRRDNAQGTRPRPGQLSTSRFST